MGLLPKDKLLHGQQTLLQLTSQFQLLLLIQQDLSTAQTDQKERPSETEPPKLLLSQLKDTTVCQTLIQLLPESHGHMPLLKPPHGQQTLPQLTSQLELLFTQPVSNIAQTFQKDKPSETD